MVDWVFAPPNNRTEFFDMLGYFNELTDVGSGGMFWTIILVVFCGILFLSMKAYSTEKASGITFVTSFVIAFLFRMLGWVNDYVVTVTFLLMILGLYLIVKEGDS